jgi:gas vesicle protein GvpN
MSRDNYSDGDVVTTLSLRAREGYIDTPAVHAVSERGLGYLRAGFPLHLRGPAGSGKTTLAFRLAAELGRPAMVIVGDETLTTGDLIGKQTRYQHKKVVDRFIHTVLKYEESVDQHWVDSKLTIACREGFTLIYDEFTRSRAEANNVLLGVMEEGLLVLPVANGGGEYVKVHPEFRIIFTSNPGEYAGVHSSQDALNDRMITLDMAYFDEETEVSIAASRSGLAVERVVPIVRLVRGYRASGEYHQIPTPRASIVIATMAAVQNHKPQSDNPAFVQLCLDVLEGKCIKGGDMAAGRPSLQRDTLLSLIDEHCRGKVTRQANGRSRANGAGASVVHIVGGV